MAEYIEREALLERLELLARHEDGFRQSVILGVVHGIKHEPAADVVEVVRCKDCKHFGGVITAYTCRLHSTGNTRIQMNADSFCSYGERREEKC